MEIRLAPRGDDVRIELDLGADAGTHVIVATRDPRPQLSQCLAFLTQIATEGGGGSCPVTFVVRDGIVDLWVKTRGRSRVALRAVGYPTFSRMAPATPLFGAEVLRRGFHDALRAALAAEPRG